MATTPKSDSKSTKFIKFGLATGLSFALGEAITYAVTTGASIFGYTALLVVLTLVVTFVLVNRHKVVGQAPIVCGILLGGFLPIVLPVVLPIPLTVGVRGWDFAFRCMWAHAYGGSC